MDFNDKVISEVRKDEQRRLYEEGNVEAARALKKTRYILMSNRSTLQKKDDEATANRVVHKGSSLFKTEDIKRKGGNEAKMAEAIIDIMDICKATGNKLKIMDMSRKVYIRNQPSHKICD